MHTALLTIGIPTFQRAGRLKDLLESIAKQYDGEVKANVEVLISDNGSTDGTLELCESYVQKHGFRFQRNAVNLGMDKNICQICKNARGEFIWWMGDDDVVREDFLPWILETLRTHTHDFFFVPAGDGPPHCTTALMGITQPTEGIVWDLCCQHGLMRFFGSIGHCLFRSSLLRDYEGLVEHSPGLTHVFGLLISFLNSRAIILTKGGFDVPPKPESEHLEYRARWANDKLYSDGWFAAGKLVYEFVSANLIPEPPPTFFKMFVRQHWPLHFHMYQTLIIKVFRCGEIIADSDLERLRAVTKYLKSPLYDELSERLIKAIQQANTCRRALQAFEGEAGAICEMGMNVFAGAWR